MDIKYFLRSAADMLLPRYCVVCGRRLRLNEVDICLFCRTDLPLTYLWKYPPDWILPLYYYRDNSQYKRLAITVKYMGNAGLGFHLGYQLGLYAAEMYAREEMTVDAVAPVPLHWMRRYRRGYNQAERIAAGFVAGYSSVSVSRPVLLPALIRRIVMTRSQTSVKVGSKADNVRRAFVPGKDLECLRTIAAEKGGGPLLLVIIDDTCTTGATLLSAASALRGCGLHLDIRFATLAKVKED